jgi:ribonuclease VapC
MSGVIDASALLAVLLEEPGGDTVLPLLPGAIMSAVNVSESASRGAERRLPDGAILRIVTRLEIEVAPFDLSLAIATAALRPATRAVGASLGDRACLALAAQRKVPLFTADRRLGSLAGQLDIDIRLIR